MSVVAVRKYKDRIEIACDSQTTHGNHKYIKARTDNNHNKFFKENGMIVAHSGLVADMSFMRVFCKTHKIKDGDVVSILEFITEFIIWCKGFNQQYQLNSSFIFIIKSG